MPDDFDDDELLARHHAGSADAFAAIVRRHADWISGVARRRVGNDAALADDVVQATFLVLAERSRTLRPGTVLSAWLFRVACNVAAGAVRDRQRRARHERASTMNARPHEPSEEWAALAPVVDALVEQLRQADREAILLRFYRQQTHGEIGRAFGIGEEAARKRVERALDRLRDAARRRGIQVGATATFAALLATGLTPGAATAGTVAIATTAAANAGVAGGNAAVLAQGATAMAITTKATLLAAAAGTAIVAAVSVVALRDPGPAAQQSATAPTAPMPTAPATMPADVLRSAERLRWIGRAVELYAIENARDRPPTLGALLGYRVANQDERVATLDVDAFFLPGAAPEAPSPATAAWVDERSPLVYLIARPNHRQLDALPRDTVALHTPLDAPLRDAAGVEVANLCLLDGTVLTLDVPRATARIDASRRAIEAPRFGEDGTNQYGQTRESMATMSNLRMLGQMIYLTQNRRADRRAPATLGAVLEMADGEPGLGPGDTPLVFLTPADLARIAAADAEPTPDWVDANTSFAYLAGGADLEKLGPATSKTVIAHTKFDAPLPHPRGGPVVVALYDDGHVEALRAADAPAIVEASRRALDAAR